MTTFSGGHSPEGSSRHELREFMFITQRMIYRDSMAYFKVGSWIQIESHRDLAALAEFS